MKRGLMVLFAMAAVVASLGCSQVAPDAGHEAVLIDKPIFFGRGGVQDNPIKTGRQWIWYSTDKVYVDMRPLQFKIHLDDFMSKDGVPLDFDAVVRLRVLNSVSLINGFGDKWYESNLEAEAVNRIRNAVRKHGMNETAISTEALDDIDKEVTEGLEAYIKASGLPVLLIQFTAGKANPPDSVKNQRIETANQQQRALTEQERKKAEDQRLEAEKSRAAADNGYRNAMSMDPAQFILLEQIKMFHEVCVRHPDGSGGGCTFLIGQTGASPVIPVGK
ncbi:MAG: SPFH domain-containing protein [Candidatus Magasanikbacteria bacterium]|nr:SPFH domain-containing protein [Candidatus Magasanikbacteria bacterium]